MAYYLIDYENVHVSGLSGLNSLTENDKVIIFYSENSDNLTFGLHRRLMTSVSDISYQKADVGTKNALDFQLASYLGYLVRSAEESTENEKFYIVSKDNGFSVLISYWKKKKVVIEMVESIAKSKNSLMVIPNPPKTSTPLVSAHENIDKEIAKVISNKSDAEIISSIIKKNNTRSEINNELCRKFDGKKVHQILQLIKPFIKDMQGN